MTLEFTIRISQEELDRLVSPEMPEQCKFGDQYSGLVEMFLGDKGLKSALVMRIRGVCDCSCCLKCGAIFNDILMRMSELGWRFESSCPKCGGQLVVNPRRS